MKIFNTDGSLLCEFEGDLSHANLSHANLWDADLSDADLWDANLRDANLPIKLKGGEEDGK